MDRVYLFENRQAQSGTVLCDQRYEWVADGIEPQIDNPDLQGLDIDAIFPRVLRALSSGQAFGGLIDSFDAAERSILDPQGIQSLLIVPIFLDDVFWGFLGFDSVRAARVWSPVETGVIKVVAAALGAAIERRRSEAELRLAVSVFESTRDAIAVADLDGRIISVNPALTVGSGYRREDLLKRNWWTLFDEHIQQQAQAGDIAVALAGPGYWHGECLTLRHSGEQVAQWLSVNVIRDARGERIRLVIVATDISPLKASEARLDHLAHHDVLTGLPNRRRIQQLLDRAIETAADSGHRVAVLFLDLDRFKSVNDSLGHPFGDELLIEAVKRLQGRLRGEDPIGRLGGDEFLIVLERLHNVDEAVAVAADLCARLREPFVISGTQVFATASVGISLYPDHATTAESLIQKADLAMYSAKQEGRDQAHLFNAALGSAAIGALTLESRVRDAIRNDGLRLHYQPRVDLRSGAVCGVEALLRIGDGEGGMLSAAQVVALAERVGLIVPIGSWVIGEACRQAAQWRAQGLPAICIAVNVSARQFYSDDLLQTIQTALAVHRLPADALEIELTESVLLHRPDEAGQVLERLGEIGVSRALDDFGTGYSSLSYLMRFPVDRLKIDRELVADLPHNQRAGAITSAVVDLAHRLGLLIVAEGIENAAQAAFLREQNFDEAQGYYFSPALPADALADLLRSGLKPFRRED
jgi:diguanylate cyclase (GGDEF)-like protein/PAS domain S-box-containing protein